MRSTEERVEAAFRGAKEIKNRQKKRRLQGGIVATMACSFCMLVMLAVVVPSMVVEEMQVANNSGFTASIFSNVNGLGYVMVGVIAFALGVSATILCILLHNRARQIEEDKNDA